MKKSLFFFCSLAPAVSLAGQSIYAPGTVSTVGNATVSNHLLSVTHNPAACHQVLKDKDKFRMAYWGSAGLYAEFGAIDNFAEEIDELVELLDENNVSLDEAEDVQNRFNDVLVGLGESGYVKMGWDLTAPGFPMAFKSENLGGNICAELTSDIQVKGSVLDSNLSFDVEDAEVVYNTQSSLYLKSAIMTRVGFSYSREVFNRDIGQWQGKLIAGAKLNFYSMNLSRQVILFESFEDEETSDIISDEYDQNQEQTTAAGLDVGVLWAADRYQLGFTIANLNEPEFDYGDVGANCQDLSGATQINNCVAALNFSSEGRIATEETHVMSALGTLDGAVAVTPKWFLSGSIDVAAYNDPVGDELQWFTLSTTYFPASRWVPGWRLGYRANLTGEELSSMNFGTTLFGVVNFDLMYGLEKTEVDGTVLPRNFALNFGLEQRF